MIYLSQIISINSIIESPTPVIVFEKEVIRQHSFLAFQYTDKIADALSYIWNEQNKWDVICNNMATDISSANLKTKVKNNKIIQHFSNNKKVAKSIGTMDNYNIAVFFEKWGKNGV